MSTAAAIVDTPVYVGYDAAQRIYGLPRHALQRLVRDRKLRVFRPGGRRALFSRAELERVIESSVETPNESAGIKDVNGVSTI
jgi:hypothetical protein